MRWYASLVVGLVVLATASTGSLVHASASAFGGVLEDRQPPVASGAVATSTSTRTPASAQAGFRYVAMGDSVAAGAGLPPLAAATPIDEVCDRSPQAYPYLIAARLQTPVTQLACSGAKVNDGIYGDQVRAGVTIPPQLSTAFASGTPDIMTVTIGANDVRWTQFIRQCYVTRCGLAIDDARMKLYRADLRIELTRMLGQIQVQSNGQPPEVLVGGYYSPIATTDCVGTDRITSVEVAWLTRQTAALNQAIRSVTPLFAFARFVPVDFSGHELCAPDPWVQGAQAAAPFHPTAAGQAMIAESFLGAMGQ